MAIGSGSRALAGEHRVFDLMSTKVSAQTRTDIYLRNDVPRSLMTVVS